MYYALGNAFVVEVENLFAKMKIFKKGGAARSEPQRILVVGNGSTLLGRQYGNVAPAVWWVSPPVPVNKPSSDRFSCVIGSFVFASAFPASCVQPYGKRPLSLKTSPREYWQGLRPRRIFALCIICYAAW